MAGGRPTDYTPEIAESICSWIAGGKSLRAFCRQDNTPDVATVCRWVSKNPDFADMYEKSKEQRKKSCGYQWKAIDRAPPKSLRRLVNDDKDKERTVYLIGLAGTDMYKVGIATDVKSRLKDIQGSNPFEVEVINTVQGTKVTEYMLQSCLESFWVRGEWFECPEAFAVALGAIMEVMKYA